MSAPDTPLKDKVVLAVDDEPDILEVVEEELDMCQVEKATNYYDGMKCLLTRTYDIVILDIMGVNGFELLKEAVSKGFPTVMLTAHALSPESLKKAIKLGAVAYLPKEKISELRFFLEDVITGGGKPIWQKTFDKLGGYFNKKFGSDWKEKTKTE